MSDPELMTISWHNTQWVIQNGLNSNNVLDYFSESPFWDKSCNNAALKMQTQYNDMKELSSELKKMRGTEYQVIHERPPVLFVIRKQNRWSEFEVTPIATYYVYKNEVYQAPDLYSILANRVMTSLYFLDKAFNYANDQVDFHPATGYTWKTSESEKVLETNVEKVKVIAQEPKELIEYRQSSEKALDSAAKKVQERRDRAIKAANVVIGQI